jgi:lysyl-tRNA synthetase class 2
MDLTEEMLSGLATAIHETTELTFREQPLSLARPWRRVSMRDAVAQQTGLAAADLDDPAVLTAELTRRGADLPPARTVGHLLMALFEAVVEPTLFQPTFVTDYPVEVSPLAKQSPEDPRFTERFELYLGGMEVANAFSELNDPDVQAERFRSQLAARAAGDDEAHRFDEDYVRALEHGMPPAGGEGIGIDRLTMLLADRSSIRDVILFPLMRPERAG